MKKKFTMLLAALFLVMGTAWAQVSYTVDATTGTGVGDGWKKEWTYTVTDTNPAPLQLKCNYNDMQAKDGLLTLYVGQNKSDTYTLTTPAVYKIVSYSFDFVKATDYTEEITLAIGDKTYTPTAEVQNVVVDNINQSSTQFTLSGANKGIKVSNFNVVIDYAESYTIGERISDFTVGTEMFIYSTCLVNGKTDYTGFFANNNNQASLLTEKPADLIIFGKDPVWVVTSSEKLTSEDGKAYYKVTLKNKATDGYLGIGGVTNNASAGEAQTFYISQWNNVVLAGDAVKAGSDVWSENVDGTPLKQEDIADDSPIWAVQAGNEYCFNTNNRAYNGTIKVAYPIVFYSAKEGKTKITENVAETTAAIAAAESFFAIAGFSGTPIALQISDAKSAGYISCSNLDTEEGNIMEWLIDGNPNSYIHTNYHSVSATNDYLDVFLGEGNGLSSFYFTELSRSGAQTDFPKSVEILGSTDGTEYISLATVDGLPQTGGKSYISPLIISDPKYVYLRFVVTTGTDRKFFHMAEFNLYGVSISEEYAGRADIFIALHSALREARKAISDLNTSNINTTRLQIEELTANASMTYPFTLTTDDENPVLYAIKSGRTNLDKGWWYTFDPTDQKIGLTQFNMANTQYWYFKEIVKNNKVYLQLYPAAGEGKAMSYNNTNNAAGNVIAKDVNNTENYKSTWLLEEVNGKYGLQTEGRENRLSNNGGVENKGVLTNNKMGMWNASPSADAGSAMYFFEKPKYPFAVTTDDENPELYAIKSGRDNKDLEWWYTYDESDNMIALTQFTGADNQYWYFKEVASDKNAHGLQLYPAVGNGMVMSYENTENGRAKIVAKELGIEGWYSTWIFETTEGNAPYGLQTEDKKNRLSNNGGVVDNQGNLTNFKMGMWNASPSADAGSAMYFISSVLDGAIAELNTLAKLSIYTEKATAAIEQARICNNRAGIEEIVLNVKKSIDGQNVKLKLKATDVRVGKFLGYDVANGRVAAVLSNGDDVIWTLKANGDGTVKLYNWVHDKYLGVPGDLTALVSEAEAAAFEIKVTANNTMALAIGENKMLHIANHTNFKAINYYSLTDPASLWEVTSIDPIVVTREEYEAAAVVTALAPTYLHTLQGQYGLVKDAAKYTSNWKSEQEGSFEALLDGDYTTYFHSAYTNEAIAEEAAAHYIQAELEAPVSGFYFYMKKRLQNDANRPVAVTVYGCDTPDGNFEKIADVETTLSKTDDYLSAKIECGKLYQYLRFEVNSTNTGTKFFTLSEFYLLPTMSFLVEPYREFKATSITSTDFSLYATAFKNAYLLETSSATQLFRLKNTASGRYMTIVEKDKAAGIKIKDKMDASVGQAYYLLKTDSLNVFQIKSTEGYFMTAFNAWDYKVSQTDKPQETAHGLEYIGEGQYRLHTWKGYAGPNNGASDEDSPLYSNHDLKNQNIAWELEPLTMTSVKYIYKYNGEELNSETFENIIEGFAYPAPTVALPFGLVAAIPEGIKGAEAEIIEIDCDVDLPFEFAEDYNSIVKWYYLNIRDENPTYLYYDPSVEYIKAIESSVPADEKDAYTWAFVGNPVDGFSIVNYKAGASMILSSPQNPNTNQNAAQLVRMVNVKDATGNKIWRLVKPTHTDKDPAPVAGAFYVQHPDATSWALNRQSYQGVNVVCYWNNRDTGSDLQVVVRNDYKDLTDLIAAAESMGVVTDGVGTFTEVTVSVFNEKLSVAKGLSESSDFSTILEATVALQKAIENLETIQPEEETFYTIQNSYSNVYMNVDGTGGMKTTNNSTMGEIFQFTLADGVTYMYNVERGTYLSMAGAHGAGQVSAKAANIENAKAVTIKNLGAENHVSITPVDGAPLHHDANYSTVVAWNGGLNSRSSWQIVEVPTDGLAQFVRNVTVNQYGYSTLYLNYPVVVPEIKGEGNGVFVASLVDDDILHMRKVDAGSTLPAKTGVVVKAEPETSCNFTYSTEAGNATSLFKGTLLNEIITPEANTTCYVLAKPKKTDADKEEPAIGFYPISLTRDKEGNNGDTSFQNGANKIYLPVETSGGQAPALMFRFGTTDVEDIVADKETEPIIYDLMGRRVEKMVEGIYIVNGKKVVIK